MTNLVYQFQFRLSQLRGSYEFHISRKARDRYQFDEGIYGLNGNVMFVNFHAARLFAQKMNDRRNLINFPEQVVKAGQINAMGLIDEILHLVIGIYKETVNPELMEQLLDWLGHRFGREEVEAALFQFGDEFPPVTVYRKEITLEEYFNGKSEGVTNREIILEEMLLLWLANLNPAFAPYLELFDDTSLERQSSYHQITSALHEFFEAEPFFGPQNKNLIDMLRSPAIAVPYSLTGQLEYIREQWAALLGRYLFRILSSLDLIKEEEKAVFGGKGIAEVIDFAALGMEFEPERFSQDKDWMPRLVLVAKNAYVWLDQLSKRYQREIKTLDQIPEEELDTLARWGITGLWLIGLWERSPASARIKRMMGNESAVASAYSLYDYRIADDLGGEAACEDLRQRAWQRGIRLASDMVPNHMGINSQWVIEHPDWFLSLDYSPFPSYAFNGADLSHDERAGIYIEDHYYDQSDAAVVFKRRDNWTGDEKFIYHGNDGTNMPWNDTAQLNFLKAEVREAVIQTIMQVARQFPVIRFDAAMTLAKKHIQRLWFPEPGSGGAIASRADHAMTKAEIDALMPQEFWREVVDRVAQEAPDTLLLAEAFWMMEGYFVRTLGMHRVYNSAFMNMLRDEDNAKYRSVMKNTLEFDPRILKRFVNFMNNPDEETAVAQFGKDNKYFGVCTMMATIPGLPMFGHGQVEGFNEKYGMEYRSSMWDEQPDAHLMERHERQIFPLLHQRSLFAEVENFLLYDFYTPEGHVNEDVFAYSNRRGDERALVVYHNKYADTRGWVKTSVAFTDKSVVGENGKLMQKGLGEGSGIKGDGNTYCLFRDHVSGLEYIRSNKELWEKGLYVELDTYKAFVFLDFREVEDNAYHEYAHLAAYLDGRGVPSIEEARREVLLQAVHHPYKELVNSNVFQRLMDARLTEPDGQLPKALMTEVDGKGLHLVREVKSFSGGEGDEDVINGKVNRKLEAVLKLLVLKERFPLPRSRKYATVNKWIKSRLDEGVYEWSVLLSWLFTHELGRTIAEKDYNQVSRSWVDEWLLNKIMVRVFRDLGFDEGKAWAGVSVVKLLTGHTGWHKVEASKKKKAAVVLEAWLGDPDVQRFLGINRFQGILWFNKEAFEEFLWWMLAAAIVEISAASGEGERDVAEEVVACYDVVNKIKKNLDVSGYQVEKLLALVRS